MTTRRSLLGASTASVLLLAGCGGAALSQDPRAAVAEGITNAMADGFSWEVTVESTPTDGAPAPANAFVVAARGLELDGVVHPDGDASLHVAYPGLFVLDTVTLVDGDAVRSFLRVEVPALPVTVADLADVPTTTAEEALLLDVARGLLTGWVEVEGDLSQLHAGGAAGESRDEMVRQLEDALAMDPNAPDVDVAALVADAEATFGDVTALLDTYLGVVEVDGAPEGQRRVDVDLLLGDLATDVAELFQRHVELEPNDVADLERGLAELPGSVGGMTATLSDTHLTSLRFDVGDFLASVGEVDEFGPLPTFALQVDLADLGSPAELTAPVDVVATFSAEQLQAALEALSEQAGAFGMHEFAAGHGDV